uniref:Uncharacterized protein n=1 Tax=Oryza brachyantha TaxID=4533 RepID=J3MF91_ORYBR
MTIFNSAVLMDYLVDGPAWTGGAIGGVLFSATLLLAFAMLLCGNALTLIGLVGRLSGGRRVAVASKCLAVGCVSLSAITSLRRLICAFPQDLANLCRLCMP